MKKFVSVCVITTLFLLLTIPVGSYLTLTFFDYLPKCEKVSDTQFNEKNLIKCIKDLRVKYPYIVLAQAKLESGNYRSFIFKNNNNLFGMKHPGVRPTTSMGTKFGYASYSSWRESVIDYLLYSTTQIKNVSSEEEYYNFLGKMYAENTSYVEVLKKMVREKKLKDLF